MGEVVSRLHFFPGLCMLFLGLGLQLPVIRWLLAWSRRHTFIWIGAAASSTLLGAGYLLEFQRVLRHFPVQWWTWLECASLVETMCLIGLSLALLVWRRAPELDRKSTRLNSSHLKLSRMPSSA